MAFREDQLTDLLSESRPNLFRGESRTMYTRTILSELSQHLDEQGRLDETGLRRVLEGTKQRGTSSANQRRFVTLVLHGLNETGLIVAKLPPRPVSVPRPAVLPASIRQGEKLQPTYAIDQHLDAWVRDNRDIEACVLALAIRLVTRLGLGEKVAVTYLARLEPQRIGGDAEIALPITPEAETHDVYRLTPPKAVADLCRTLRARVRRQGVADWLMNAAQPGERPSDTPARCRETRQRLDQAYQRLRRAVPEAATTWPTTWAAVAHAGRMQPLRRHMPPVFVELVRDFPLPASAAQPWWLHGPARIRDVAAPPPSIAERSQDARSAGEAPLEGTLPELPADWFRFAATLRRGCTRRIAELYEGSERHIQKRADQLRGWLRSALEAADAHIGTQTSIVHVALEWAFHLKVNENLKSSSIETYLSRLLNRTLLSQEVTQDLKEWDDETIEEILSDIYVRESWGAKTQEHFHTTFTKFLDFASDRGLCESVRIPKRESSSVHNAYRTALLSPFDVDDLVKDFLQHSRNDRYQHMFAVILVLGYYGGLRASEVANLTLRDILSGDGECFVYIRAGKTPAARRKIPLHDLAPGWRCELLKSWAAERRQELRGSRALPEQIGVFGPYREHGTLSRAHLIDPLIHCLSLHFREHVDFHTLRHNTVSWLLLRLHAARYPDFREGLAVRMHETFAPEWLEEFRAMLCRPAGNNSERQGIHLVQIAKIIGHRDVGTLLVNYGHSISHIHSDLIQRAWCRGSPQI